MSYNQQDNFYNSSDKKAEQEKTSKIYSTDEINKILEKRKRGVEVDMAPFFHGNIDYKDAGLIYQYTEEEMQELEKCANDCVYFVSKYCKFLNDKGWTLIKLRDYQQDMLKLYSEEEWDPEIEEFIVKNQYIVGMSSRQSAKTTTVSAYFTWAMVFHNDKQVGVVANKAKTSREIVGKVKKMIEGLPFFMKPGVLRVAQETITLENGSYLMSASTNPTSVTGQSINLLYLDEAAHIQANLADDFWKSVFPTLSSFRNKQIIITSTPKGKQNLFYRLYDGACKGINTFKHYRVDWWQVPGRDEKWEKETRANFGNEEFDQEFGLQFDTDSTKLIRSIDFQFMRRIKKEYKNIEFDELSPNLCKNLFWDPNFDPTMLLEDDLLNRRFLFIIDTAEGKQIGIKGKQDSDWNVINIFEIEPLSIAKIRHNAKYLPTFTIKDSIRYRQIGIYLDNNNDEESSAAVLKYLVYNIFKSGQGMIDNCRILLEMNFNGKNFLNKFMDHSLFYGALVLKTYHVKPIPGVPQKKSYGFKTSPGSMGKSYFCELGAKMIARHQIIVNQYNNETPTKSSISQLENFGKNSKGLYEGSCMHDDIAVTVLFISHVNDIPEFFDWIEEWFDSLEEYNNMHILHIKEILNMYINNGEEEYTDDDFKSLYGIDENQYNTSFIKPMVQTPYLNNNIQNPYLKNNY